MQTRNSRLFRRNPVFLLLLLTVLGALTLFFSNIIVSEYASVSVAFRYKLIGFRKLILGPGYNGFLDIAVSSTRRNSSDNSTSEKFMHKSYRVPGHYLDNLTVNSQTAAKASNESNRSMVSDKEAKLANYTDSGSMLHESRDAFQNSNNTSSIFQEGIGRNQSPVVGTEETRASVSDEPPRTFSSIDIKDKKFPPMLLAFKVVQKIGVSVRALPSPIGAIKSDKPIYKPIRHHDMDEVLIGYKVVNRFGNWLQLGENQWVPITKKFTQNGPFLPVLKLFKKLPLPKSFNKYYNMPPKDCNTIPTAAAVSKCTLLHGIRNEVIRIMTENKFVSANESYKSIIHPEKNRAGKMNYLPDDVSDKTEPDGDSVTDTEEEDDFNVFGSEGVNDNLYSEPLSYASDDEKEVFVNEILNEFQPSELENENAKCSKCHSWACCFKFPLCAWKGKAGESHACLYEHEYVPPADLSLEEYNPEFDISVYDTYEGKKYFLYQPSGGWNNQRIQLENAILICRLTNRICILPPVSRHTNYYYNYNVQTGDRLLSIQRVLNIPLINETMVEVATIPQGKSFVEFVEEARRFSAGNPDQTWKIVNRKGANRKKWDERDIKHLFGDVKDKFLYFSKQSMWSSLEWKGKRLGLLEKDLMRQSIMYSNPIKKVAQRLSYALGTKGAYHAIHVRRADHRSLPQFKELAHTSFWYSDKLKPFMNTSKFVYIATDEENRLFFNSFKRAGFTQMFWTDLDQGILLPFLERYPSGMARDILGMVEQLICTYAIKFLGSGYSTFTTYILRMRQYRRILAADTSVDSKISLPYNARNSDSSCKGYESLSHSQPC